ncbi:Extradiol aromatic ring-opening dioxygenase [Gonapodya prolifera JEL478]|uniref:Extradiol aromatic ring-opening dioxygenase n=1 Tax=Gonapodya prolifera (strain JEL478) TaxID=1344416 RepID=A0A139B0H1_GONPJ|nr:Extradiol aromatic ring-opening dioxygenase [Gonapodya prolifera JEL478]|eukprot:KXS22467.1 Extradiol aromatic ring-opening dioxygenase [Gonapodya prolifera JEL478]
MRLPAFFINHGPPSLGAPEFESSPTVGVWRAIGKLIHEQWRQSQVKGVVMVSAHWRAAGIEVTSAENPAIFHDFNGFPSVSNLSYSPRGSTTLATQLAKFFDSSPIPCSLNPLRAFDHGAWCPLLQMLPEADVPVFEMSIASHHNPAWHFAVGIVLRQVRDEGYIVVGSGGSVHNLAALDDEEVFQESVLPPLMKSSEQFYNPMKHSGSAADVESWALDFERDLVETLERAGADPKPLLSLAQSHPNLRRAHPTMDHLMPLLVVAGTAHADETVEQVWRSYICGGGLSLGVWSVGGV